MLFCCAVFFRHMGSASCPKFCPVHRYKLSQKYVWSWAKWLVTLWVCYTHFTYLFVHDPVLVPEIFLIVYLLSLYQLIMAFVMVIWWWITLELVHALVVKIKFFRKLERFWKCFLQLYCWTCFSIKQLGQMMVYICINCILD